MTKMMKLSKVDDVKRIYEIAITYDVDIDAQNDNYSYVIDAKSLMGLICLDFSEPIKFTVHTNDTALAAEILQKFEDALK